MENKKIIYRNRLEIKILSIAYAVILGPLFAFIIVNDIIDKNEKLMHNISFFCLILAVLLIPVLIIARFRIVFDYQAKEILYVPYLGFKRKIPFKEIKVAYVIRKDTKIPFYYYVFYKNRKKLFKIEASNFTDQTGESVYCLKSLFTGIEKENFDWEEKYSGEGIQAFVVNYSSARTAKKIYLENQFIDIDIQPINETDLFEFKVSQFVFGSCMTVESIELKTMQVSMDAVDSVCDQLIEKYKRT